MAFLDGSGHHKGVYDVGTATSRGTSLLRTFHEWPLIRNYHSLF